MRLQKFLARAGAASRRGSENLMTAGRVRVNGVVATELGTKVDPLTDIVEVDGIPVSLGSGKVYLVLNKPQNVVTTMSDPQGRPCVAQYVPHERFPGLFPVGRLDRDTTGVLLFTTDGDLAARLLHPSTHVYKVYHARVDGVLKQEDFDLLEAGIELDDGLTAPAVCHKLMPQDAIDVCAKPLGVNESLIEITLHEGKKRQVKRMLSAIGHPVLQLCRASFGNITAQGLDHGAWRLLSAREIEILQELSEDTRYTGTRYKEEDVS
ncbi:MAG: rRNA pseudouridine synthase [Coriobacteriales bacterium]|nr:rRNA pseudouridine synthase [Coriobacteriales bacterium]